jgi:hypothetical protein
MNVESLTAPSEFIQYYGRICLCERVLLPFSGHPGMLTKSRRELDREVMKSPKGYRRKKIYMVRNLV